MEPMPLVWDISSDEEFEKGTKSNDYDWIKEFLGMSDEDSDNNSDDVFIVREVKPEKKTKSSTPTVKDVDDDDDCVVLDGDPENSVSSVKEAVADELLIVGEKGQVACRDYPHPRHHCANFPFSLTPHERHCDQCHCYVCDSPAPCLKWGTGISSTDHCHATDKDEMWKIQRKNFKLGKTASLPASANYGTSLNVGHPQCNQILPLDIIQSSPNSVLPNQATRSTAMRTCSSLNPIPQNQAARPTIMRTCSSSLNSSLQNQASRSNTTPICSRATNFTIPNGANRGRFQESGYTLPRNRPHPYSVPRQLLGVRNHAIQRERGRASSLRPQSLRSHMMFKEVGSVGSALTANHSAHGSSSFSNLVNPPEQYDKYHAAAGFSNDRTCYEQNGVWVPQNLSYAHPSSEPTGLSCVRENTAASGLSCVRENTAASETPTYGQPLSQSNDSQNLYGSCIQVDDVPSSYVASLNSNQHQNEHRIGSRNKNASGNITQCGITSEDTCQHKPHEESPSGTTRKADFSAFDSSWADNTNQSIESLMECPRLQSLGSTNQLPNVKESVSQFTGSANFNSVDDIENWLFNKDSVPVLADGALPSELNMPSPELNPIDTGMFLFDFENSWNGLAHA